MIDYQWSDHEVSAFRSAWRKLKKNAHSIAQAEGLRSSPDTQLGVRFRNKTQRETFEHHLAVYLGKELNEKFQRMCGWKFTIAGCNYARKGQLCLYCKQAFAKILCKNCLPLPEARKLMHKERARRAEKTNLERRGVKNPSHDPEVIERIREAFRSKDPEGKATNAMHIPSIRKKWRKAIDSIDQVTKAKNLRRTLQENWGYSHWLKSGAGKKKFKAAIRALYAVDNVMQDPEIRRHHANVMKDLFQDQDWLAFWKEQVRNGTLAKLGVDNAFKHPDVIKKIQSVMLVRYGKKHALQVKEFMSKYWATCVERFGGHPMHVSEIRAKQLKNSLSRKEVVIQGRVFTLQGYEPFVLRKLLNKFDVDDIIGQPKGFHILRKKKYHPDFYIKSLKLYFEVKSSFTLLTGHEGNSFEANARKARLSHKAGKEVQWVVAYPNRDIVVSLPRFWYRMTKVEVEDFLRDKLSQATEKRRQHL